MKLRRISVLPCVLLLVLVAVAGTVPAQTGDEPAPTAAAQDQPVMSAAPPVATAAPGAMSAAPEEGSATAGLLGVAAVVLVIWIALFAYVFRLDRRLRDLEEI